MKPETAKTIRTTVQVVLSVAAAMPILLAAVPVGTASGIGAVLIAVAAIITRIHQIPEVSAALSKYLKVPR